MQYLASLTIVAIALASAQHSDTEPRQGEGQSLAVAAAAEFVYDRTWHALNFFAPANEQFIGISGQMVVPPKPPKSGPEGAPRTYLWPGVQPQSGVFQNVLDSFADDWRFASGFYGDNTDYPWGDGFNTKEGDVLSFNDTKGASAWTAKISHTGGPETASNDFPLNDRVFYEAIFAIELLNTTWEFGPLSFSNILITCTGSDSSWCNNNPQNPYNTIYSITGLRAEQNGGNVDCYMDSLVLERQGP
ncbi:Hypothetical predicted protein [Lecanosticta acicola]|uniref:Uncharacterized protein n=1 Tax=Lecanosticta acicola TaxID=111012 RepID=A0AAI8Z7D9_9PEZI|nr:Hypothetical predicted protein [Lecanosticta acicola]